MIGRGREDTENRIEEKTKPELCLKIEKYWSSDLVLMDNIQWRVFP